MMHVDVLFSGVAVTDLERSAEWYARLLGRPHDITVNEDEVMWQIVLKGWLYLVTDPSRAGNCFFSARRRRSLLRTEGHRTKGR